MTEQQYQELKALNARYDAWYKSIGSPGSYKADAVPEDCRMTNEQRSKIQIYEFIHSPPEKCFLYIREPERTAVTFTGDKLGDVQFGATWRGNMGDTRVSVRIAAINGKTYAGTYYKSSGSYARVKLSRYQ